MPNQQWHQVGVGDEFSVGSVAFQLRRLKPNEFLDLAVGE
jgi:hypothetical protein